ncbi:hypothetical protein ACT691_05895 [Vibrio metschnikovii]
MKIYKMVLTGLLATFSLSSAAALTVEQTKQLADIEQILQRNPQVIEKFTQHVTYVRATSQSF